MTFRKFHNIIYKIGIPMFTSLQNKSLKFTLRQWCNVGFLKGSLYGSFFFVCADHHPQNQYTVAMVKG